MLHGGSVLNKSTKHRQKMLHKGEVQAELIQVKMCSSEMESKNVMNSSTVSDGSYGEEGDCSSVGPRFPRESDTFASNDTSSAESVNEELGYFDDDDLANLVTMEDGYSPRNLSKFWLGVGRIATHSVVGGCLIALTVLVSVTLGVISVFVVEPKPYFDRSLESFQIPNHVSTMRSDLFRHVLSDTLTNLSTRVERDVAPLSSTSDTGLENGGRFRSRYKSYAGHDIPSGKQRTIDQRYSRFRRSSEKSPPQLRTGRWNMELVFIAKPEGANIFTAERLKRIHEVEMSIMKHPSFSNYCQRTWSSVKDPALKSVDYCSPLNSLMTYFFPSLVDSKIVFDGMGSELADINGTLHKAMSKESFYWYVDPEMDVENQWSRFIRSEVWFGRPGSKDPSVLLSLDEQYQSYYNFVISYKELLQNISTETVDVLYGGNEIFDYEVSTTIHHDLMLAIPTVVAITTLLFILTSFSAWLTLCGIISILSSFSLAYFSYHVICGKEALGLLNLVSAFVVIGIGVDDVFVFVNTFRQAVQFKDLKLRMAHTIKVAGVATFFTSVTTAGAFGANMASQIPAVYEFGLFMTFIISYCWLLVVLIMPAALALWHKFLYCEQALFKRILRRKHVSPTNDYPTIRPIQDGPSKDNVSTSTESSGYTTSTITMPAGSSPAVMDGPLDNDVIQLLDFDDQPPTFHQDSTADLGQMDDAVLHHHIRNNDLVYEQKELPSDKHETASLTVFISRFLTKYVGEPVVKWRWMVLVSYTVILLVTVGLVSQIEPATRPPALFKEDTNLQRLLDLAYNFSAQDISCKSCSGFSQPPQVVTDPNMDLRPSHVEGTTSVQRNPVTAPEIQTQQPVVLTEKPSCATKQCLHYSICEDDPAGTGPVCTCDFNCGEVLAPVCDNHGVTHINLCSMKQESCIRQHYLRVAHRGPCAVKKVTSPPATKKPIKVTESLPPLNMSAPEGYDPCKTHSCHPPAEKPILRNTATVYLMFGVSRLDRGTISHHNILSDSKGTVYYDKDFDVMRTETQRALCRMCHHLANREDLVKPGGAECFPGALEPYLDLLAESVPECRDIPKPNYISGQKSRSLAKKRDGRIVWFTMAFESNIFEGKSSFDAFHDFLAWEKVVQDMLANLTSEERVGLETVFQTCDYWEQVFMEIVGVTSAIYGLVFSLIVCVASVIVFTGHIGVAMIALVTILGIMLVVISTFYLLGWQLGAVEAVSLSILVGSSVDYCIHLIEGFLTADEFAPAATTGSKLRQWKTKHAISTIGVSILSSAITTVIASIPLCFTTIQLFSKFGKIVAINTLVAIVYTLTVCMALLSTFAPSKYRWNKKWLVASLLILVVTFGALVGIAYVLHLNGVSIPGPSGGTLF